MEESLCRGPPVRSPNDASALENINNIFVILICYYHYEYYCY